MKIHVEGPLNAYIHLVDSFLALKVETFDRFTFEQLSGLFMNISIIRRHLPLHHANPSTLKNIFIINNFLDFFTILDFLRTHHLLPSALAVIELSVVDLIPREIHFRYSRNS